VHMAVDGRLLAVEGIEPVSTFQFWLQGDRAALVAEIISLIELKLSGKSQRTEEFQRTGGNDFFSRLFYLIVLSALICSYNVSMWEMCLGFVQLKSTATDGSSLCRRPTN